MDSNIYPVPEATRKRTLIDEDRYEEMYARSVSDNEGFWADAAQRIVDDCYQLVGPRPCI